MLREKSSVIASFVGHPVCSNFKTYSVLILFYYYFDIPQFTQNASIKVIHSWNFKCSAKGAVILLLSWSVLYIAVWKCVVSSFYFFFYFDLPLVTQIACVKVTFSWNNRCSAKGAVILLLSWSTLYIAISKYMCKTHLFLKILGAPAKETVIFFLLWISLYIGFSNCIVSLF